MEVTDPDTGDVYTDYERITKNNAVANASTLTVNFDLTERNGQEETVMIDNLANLQGATLGTITVSADQASGSYILAQGAEAFTGSLTIKCEGDQDHTISVGDMLQVQETVYKLSNTTDAGLVFSIMSTDAAVTDILATVGGNPLQKGQWTNQAINIKVEVNQYSKSIWYRVRKLVGLRGYDEWLELDNEAGVDVAEYCEVDFKAVSEKGVDSKVVTYTVNYDSTPAAITDLQFTSVTGNSWYDDGDECVVSVLVTDNLDEAPILELQTAEGEWTPIAQGADGRHAFTVTGNGNYNLRATDHAGNVASEVISVDFFNLPAIAEAVADGVAWEGHADAKYFVALSGEAGPVAFDVAGETSLSLYNLPNGEYSLAVSYSDAELEAAETTITQATEYKPSVWAAVDDGVLDVFFAQNIGVWDGQFVARHTGIKDGWEGTQETVLLEGKNRLADVFVGGAVDANILLLTDEGLGDTLFVDDLYTELPGELEEQQARVAQITEIYAGAGNDLIDLTSQRFEYVGSGMVVLGGDGDDVIWANKGNNLLFGDAGNDRIVGASGNDFIAGGAGDDVMHGGGGEDTFLFGGNWGNDTVTQLADGKVTLWFQDGDNSKWDADKRIYSDGANSVQVLPGVADVALKFGDDGSELYQGLLAGGAFDQFASDKIFNEKDKGMLA